MQGFARKLEGYDAADLRALVERALHAALMRRLASRPRPTGMSPLVRAFLFYRVGLTAHPQFGVVAIAHNGGWPHAPYHSTPS